MVTDADTLFIILSAGILIAIFLGLHTEWRLDRLMRGKSGKNLEEIIVENASDLNRFKQFRKELETYLETVEKRLHQSVRGVGTVRFNPFKGTGDGGSQSFASAFINEKGNGVVFSSLYVRERMSVFAKPLINGKSEYELTGEEWKAIKIAQQKLRE